MKTVIKQLSRDLLDGPLSMYLKAGFQVAKELDIYYLVRKCLA